MISNKLTIVLLSLAFLLFPTIGNAEQIIFEGSSAAETTGERFENVSNVWATNQVAEFQGLEIRAKTLDSTHKLNANNGEFGINSDLVGENSEAFDVGETLVLSFDSPVRIDLLDLNRFDTGEGFAVEVAGKDVFDVVYDDLDNKTGDYISFSSGIRVEAETEVKLYVTSGQIGLDAIEVTVIPEPAVISLVILFGTGGIVARRFFG